LANRAAVLADVQGLIAQRMRVGNRGPTGVDGLRDLAADVAQPVV
jgi:hypothetical protein